MAMRQINAATTALVVIDMQGDFCRSNEDTYLGRIGLSVANTREPIQPLQVVLSELRRRNFAILHTREGHRPSLSDCPELKLWRSKMQGCELGTVGASATCFSRALVRGQPSWDIILELKPAEGEDVVDGCGKGKFVATDLDMLLRQKGVTTLIFGGVTTSCCVATTMREATDLGYECFVLSDGTGDLGVYDYLDTIRMVGEERVLSSEALLVHVRGGDQAPLPLPPLHELRGVGRVSSNIWAAMEEAIREGGLMSLRAKLAGDARGFIDELQRRAAAEGVRRDEHGHLLVVACDGARTNAWPFKPSNFGPPSTALLCLDLPSELELPNGEIIPWAAQLAKLGAAAGAAGVHLVICTTSSTSAGEPTVHVPPWALPHKPTTLAKSAGAGAFSGTALDATLRSLGATNLILAGLGASTAVNTTMRQASDRGYDTLIAADCVGAEDDADLWGLSESSIRKAIFSACAHSDAVHAWLHAWLQAVASLPDTKQVAAAVDSKQVASGPDSKQVAAAVDVQSTTSLEVGPIPSTGPIPSAAPIPSSAPIPSAGTISSTASLEAVSACPLCGSPLYLDAAANALGCPACECASARPGILGTNALGNDCFVDHYSSAIDYAVLVLEHPQWFLEALARARRSGSLATIDSEDPKPCIGGCGFLAAPGGNYCCGVCYFRNGVHGPLCKRLPAPAPWRAFVPSTGHVDLALAAAAVFSELKDEIDWARHHDILADGRMVSQPRSIAYQADDASLVYVYEGLAAPLVPTPFTPFVRSLKVQVEKLCGGVAFNSAHLNLYNDGTEHVSWHTDQDVALYGDSPTIASVSFGAEREFVLRRMVGVPYSASWRPCEPREHLRYVLRDGDVLVMRGATQRYFEHALLKAGHTTYGSRVNITFRVARPRSAATPASPAAAVAVVAADAADTSTAAAVEAATATASIADAGPAAGGVIHALSNGAPTASISSKSEGFFRIREQG